MSYVKKLAAAGVLALGIGGTAKATIVDVAFVVDQSGSMGGEFAWIPTVMNEIQVAIASEASITSARYGVVGYMENPHTRANGTPLVYHDLTASVGDVATAVTGAPLYCCAESGYEAAHWSMAGFSWDQNAVKIMILLTDESGDQNSDIGVVPGGVTREQHLGNVLDAGGFLLNVVTTTNRYAQWDEAAFDINDVSYTGLFDIAALRNAGSRAQFTTDFVNAKLQEIKEQGGQVPAPAALGILGFGLAGLGVARRRRSF